MVEKDSDKIDTRYFVVKVVPVNDPQGMKVMTSTWQEGGGGGGWPNPLGTTTAAALGVDPKPVFASCRGFRFEIADMTDYEAFLSSKEGCRWLDDAVDHAVFQVAPKQAR